jgi:hypothetical protein
MNVLEVEVVDCFRLKEVEAFLEEGRNQYEEEESE